MHRFIVIAVTAATLGTSAAAAPRSDEPAATARPASLECRQFVPDANIVIKVPCPEAVPVAPVTPQPPTEARPAEDGKKVTTPEPKKRTERPTQQPGKVRKLATEIGEDEAPAQGKGAPTAQTAPTAAPRLAPSKLNCSELVERTQAGAATADETARLKAGC